MENKEKLAVDIFIKFASRNVEEFKNAIYKGKMFMMRDIHLNENFNPKKYVRYYLTFKINKLPENVPLPQFNISQQRIERLHNAAIALEILEQKLNDLNDHNLFFYFEVGGIYVLEEGEQINNNSWYEL